MIRLVQPSEGLESSLAREVFFYSHFDPKCCLISETKTPRCVNLILISKIKSTSIFFFALLLAVAACKQWLTFFSSLGLFERSVAGALRHSAAAQKLFLTPVPTSSSCHSLKPHCDRKSESRRRKPKPQKPTIRKDVSSYLTPKSPPHGNLLPCCHGQRETATADESLFSRSSSLIL